MPKLLGAATLAVAFISVLAGPSPVSANPIEQACMRSDRPGATRELCRCIGGAADMTLTPSDMREGARFFSDPARAEQIQLSDTRRDDAFWSRWQGFAEAAEALCN